MATKPHSRIRLSALAVVATAIGALVWAAGASALTLGSVAPPDLGGCGDCDAFQATTGGGAPSYSVPKGKWTITSWSAQGGGTQAGKARLRVYRRTATPDQFELVRQSAREPVPADAAPVFPTSLNVKKGDLLGLGTKDGLVSAYRTGLTGNLAEGVHCPTTPLGVGTIVGPGTACGTGDLPDSLVNVSAELTPR